MSGKRKNKGRKGKGGKGSSRCGFAPSPKTITPPWDQRATISLCMIVKNEEKRLKDALNSCLTFVDEVVVVDNGSTDGTLNILRQARAESKRRNGPEFRILHQDWSDRSFSFSESRNFGIKHARGDFIFQLDADEAIEPSHGGLLREAAQRMKYEDLKGVGCIFFQLQNVMRDGKRSTILHPHLFRRLGCITGAPFKFVNMVHNKPVWEGEAIDCPLVIYHYGYGEDDATMAAKHQRRRQMIGAWMESDPDDFWPNFYWCQTLGSELGHPEETIAACKRAIEVYQKTKDLVNVGVESLARVYYCWLTELTREKRAVEALEVSNECLSLLPWYPDPLFFRAWAQMHLGSWKDCCSTCVEFFDSQQRAAEDDSIRLKFVGVENLTVDRGPEMVRIWRTAAKHCLGCAAEDTGCSVGSQEPSISSIGYRQGQDGKFYLDSQAATPPPQEHRETMLGSGRPGPRDSVAAEAPPLLGMVEVDLEEAAIAEEAAQFQPQLSLVKSGR